MARFAETATPVFRSYVHLANHPTLHHQSEIALLSRSSSFSSSADQKFRALLWVTPGKLKLHSSATHLLNSRAPHQAGRSVSGLSRGPKVSGLPGTDCKMTLD